MAKTAAGLLLPIAMSAFAADALAATPSFDCAKASHDVEKVICTDAELAELDHSLNSLYHAVLEHTPAGEQKML